MKTRTLHDQHRSTAAAPYTRLTLPRCSTPSGSTPGEEQGEEQGGERGEERGEDRGEERGEDRGEASADSFHPCGGRSHNSPASPRRSSNFLVGCAAAGVC